MEGKEEVKVEIVERIGLLDKPHENGWALECNVVAWNGRPPKVDIREWSPDHERMSRGITLTEDQAERLAMHLSQRVRARNLASANRDTMER